MNQHPAQDIRRLCLPCNSRQLRNVCIIFILHRDDLQNRQVCAYVRSDLVLIGLPTTILQVTTDASTRSRIYTSEIAMSVNLLGIRLIYFMNSQHFPIP